MKLQELRRKNETCWESAFVLPVIGIVFPNEMEHLRLTKGNDKLYVILHKSTPPMKWEWLDRAWRWCRRLPPRSQYEQVYKVMVYHHVGDGWKATILVGFSIDLTPCLAVLKEDKDLLLSYMALEDVF